MGLSLDDKRLVCRDYFHTTLWDVATRRKLAVWEQQCGFPSVALSADGRTAATGGNGEIRLWKVSDGALIRTLRGHADAVNGVAFSPRETRLASGGWDGFIKLWDPDTGNELASVDAGHRVYSIAFSPDGKLLASAGGSRSVAIQPRGVVRLWDVAKLR